MTYIYITITILHLYAIAHYEIYNINPEIVSTCIVSEPKFGCSVTETCVSPLPMPYAITISPHSPFMSKEYRRDRALRMESARILHFYLSVFHSDESVVWRASKIHVHLAIQPFRACAGYCDYYTLHSCENLFKSC